MSPLTRAVLLWLAIGIAVYAWMALHGHRVAVRAKDKSLELGFPEGLVAIFLWPFALAAMVEAWWAVRRDMRAMHGDDPSKWPSPDDDETPKPK